VLMLAIGLLNRASRKRVDTGTWFSAFNKKFQSVFADAMEVAVFVLFLTMDSTALFFLPSSLNIPLRAELFGFDLMVRGWDFSHGVQFTLTIVMITVVNQYIGSTNEKLSTGDQIKHAIRQSFEANKDDVVKFITYFTILIFVFLAFPKLKLLSMATASAVGLLLDFMYRDRMSVKRGEDLISRIITKVFKV